MVTGLVHLVPDSGGVAEALRARFVDEGQTEPTCGTTIPTEATRVVILTALSSGISPSELDARVIEVFQSLRTLGQSRRATPIEIFFAQNLGGDLGLASDPGNRAVLGAIAGLAKTAAREWPQAAIRVIDFPGDLAPKELADALFDEIGLECDELEVGLRAGVRGAPRLLRTTTRVTATRASKPDDVWIVSGGARGVTPACLKALVQRGPLRLALLGRTPIDDPEAPAARDCTNEADLKRALLDEANARGLKLKPTELKRQVEKVIAAREARATCAVLRNLGAEVKYFALDATDAGAVQEVVKTLRQEWGPIRGLVHAAGVLADKALHEKTDDQFLAVYRTKVEVFRALLAATRDEPLTSLIAFSSVAARVGNAGQADYAAANEALNKLCQSEQHRRGAGCVVRSINWGPWDGGMVSVGLKAHFAAMGVPLIPLEGGADVFVDLVTGVIPASVECVVGAAGLSTAGVEPAVVHVSER